MEILLTLNKGHFQQHLSSWHYIGVFNDQHNVNVTNMFDNKNQDSEPLIELVLEILLTLNKGHFQQHFRCIMAVNEIRVLRVNNRPSCG
jgi:hypothetical protein